MQIRRLYLHSNLSPLNLAQAHCGSYSTLSRAFISWAGAFIGTVHLHELCIHAGTPRSEATCPSSFRLGSTGLVCLCNVTEGRWLHSVVCMYKHAWRVLCQPLAPCDEEPVAAPAYTHPIFYHFDFPSNIKVSPTPISFSRSPAVHCGKLPLNQMCFTAHSPDVKRSA